MSFADKRLHQIDNPINAIRLPLLWEVWDLSKAPFLHRWAWCCFILQAFGTEFLIVFPTSNGLERNQFAISSAMKLRLRVLLDLLKPLMTEKFSSESSVGCPGSNWCFPPPTILKASAILAGLISLSNSKCAPMTSPRTAPHNAPFICYTGYFYDSIGNQSYILVIGYVHYISIFGYHN